MDPIRTLVTAEELAGIAGDRRVELVRGELVEMSPVDLEHSGLVALLISWLVAFVSPRKLGHVGTECGFILSRKPDIVRAPDIHFIPADRLGSKPSGFFAGAPDLAIEVVSQYDRPGEVQQKIREYLSAGARLVWLVDPRSETVTVYPRSGEPRVYAGNQDVAGEEVLPGFSFRPAALFRF
ncbi:MAG: Uma2 family endonuclease [Gammaproteobacteria bacterium]